MYCSCTTASILINLFSLHSLDDAEYVKAMAEGGGNLEHLNIVLHGPPGSGKSSLKRAILGEDPLPQVEQNSTGIMENAVRAVSMDRMKSFTVIKDKDLLELLAASMKHCAQQKSSQELMLVIRVWCHLPHALPDSFNPFLVPVTLVVLLIHHSLLVNRSLTISLCCPVNHQRYDEERKTIVRSVQL